MSLLERKPLTKERVKGKKRSPAPVKGILFSKEIVAKTIFFFVSHPSSSPQIGKSTRPLTPFIFPICCKAVAAPVIVLDFLNPGVLGESRIDSLFLVVMSMPVEAASFLALGAHCKNLIVAGLFIRIPDLTHFFVLGSYLDQQTLKGKIKLTEKMMLERVKMEVEKRVKIKMIRNLALQSDLEPQNQVAYHLTDM